METLRHSIRFAHIALGFTGLVAFWIPVFARKGSRLHVVAGRVFAWCVYFVAGSAVVNSLILMGLAIRSGQGPAASPDVFGFLVFLFYLGLTTFASGRHAVRVVEAKHDPTAIDTPFHRVMAVAPAAGSLVVIAYALRYWSGASIVFLALSTIGLSQGRDIWRYMTREPASRMSWWYEHMGAMLGTGIAFHTAFAVFGASRLLDYSLSGPLALVPWILPAAIGIPAIQVWTRHYRRRFGELPGAVAVESGT